MRHDVWLRTQGAGPSSVMAPADDLLRAALEDRLRFETLIADLSAQLVNLDSDLIDGAIQDAQRRIVEALDLDRSSLFQFAEDGTELIFTHYWSRPGYPAPPFTANPTALFPWATARILSGEMLYFSSVTELPSEGPDRENMIRMGTKSNVTVPLIVSGRVVGALAFAVESASGKGTRFSVHLPRIVSV